VNGQGTVLLESTRVCVESLLQEVWWSTKQPEPGSKLDTLHRTYVEEMQNEVNKSFESALQNALGRAEYVVEVSSHY
jgi:hypothetical protein